MNHSEQVTTEKLLSDLIGKDPKRNKFKVFFETGVGEGHSNYDILTSKGKQAGQE